MKKLSLTVFNIFKIAAMLLVKTAAMFLGLYTFFYLLFYIYFTLTVNLNFCVSQMSTVPDEIKIRLAVEDLLKHQRAQRSMPVYMMGMDGEAIKTDEFKTVETILYESVDDFLEKNPTCCSLYRITETDRPFYVYDMVYTNFKFYYLENNEIKYVNLPNVTHIDACGNILKN